MPDILIWSTKLQKVNSLDPTVAELYKFQEKKSYNICNCQGLEKLPNHCHWKHATQNLLNLKEENWSY